MTRGIQSSGPRRSREDAASTASAYVYGNITVLAALATLDPRHMNSARAIGVIAGVGVATFIAHVFSDMISHLVQHGESPSLAQRGREMRNALPIISSTATPALVILLGMAGVWPPAWTASAAFAAIAVRLALFGSILTRASGQRSPMRVFLAGIVFAALALLIALVKALLSH